MNVSIDEVRNAVLRAKEQVRSSGVTGTDVEVFASTIAAIELMKSHDNGGNLTAVTLDFPETFAEWSSGFNLQSHYDRFVAIAVYLREKQQLSTVNSDDIMQMYRKARWERPANPSDVLAKAAKRLFFAEDDSANEEVASKRRWQVTRSGHKYLQTLMKEGDNG